jgi:hypothetical protein
MIMPCRSGSMRSRGLSELTACERQRVHASATGITCVRSRAPGTLGIPGGHARRPQVRAYVPS